MKNYVDQADMCELAHKLTVKDCKRLKIKVDKLNTDGEEYTAKAQGIFDGYYKLITETLNV